MTEQQRLEQAVASLGDEHATTPRCKWHENTSYTPRDLEIERRKQEQAKGK